MYIRDVYDETGLARLHDLIERYNFGMLISNGDPTPFVSQLPFVLDREKGPNGTLYVHLARANPQWRGFDGEVLALFRGPHGYVSPSWYEPGQNAVPTWNYAVVHACGTPRRVDDPAAVRAQQEQLVAFHETGRTPAWDMADQPASYIEAMLRGIVAFEIPIARLQGKFKLSQDRADGDRHRVADALIKDGSDESVALARLMSQT